jgi:hypothetical protein
LERIQMTAGRDVARAGAIALMTLAALILGSTGVALAAPPSVTIEAPANGGSTSNQRPLFSGASSDSEDLITVEIYAGSSATGTPVQTMALLLPTVSGAWSAEPEAPLAQGHYTAVAEQTNEASETGTSTAVTFTVDTTPPTVTIDAVPSPTDDPTPTLSGDAHVEEGSEEVVTVTIYEGDTTAGTTVGAPHSLATSDEAWQYTPPHLADGTYTAQATRRDEAGNLGISSAVTFTVDTTPPAVSLNPVKSPTDEPEPTLSGDAGVEAGDDTTVAVTIYKGNTTGTVAAGPTAVTAVDGTWKYTPPHLSDGTYTAQASQQDAAGNTGMSAPATFTIDTIPPAVSITEPANISELHVSRPTFSGLAGHADGDEQSVTLKIYEAEGSSGSPVQTVEHLTPVDGKWTTMTSLPDGAYRAVAEQSDEAGNTGTSTVQFRIETHSPAVTLTTTGLVQRAGGPVSGPTPSFTGTAASELEDESVLVKIYSGTSTSPSPRRTVDGSRDGSIWTAGPITEPLPDGTYTAQAEQEDHEGQIGVSASSTFTVDADPPLVTLTSPAEDSSATGSSQVLSGSAGTAEGDLSTITIELFKGSTITGTSLEAVTVQASGGSWSGAFGGLSPGTYTAQAEQHDDVGNTGHSTPVTFTVTAPTQVTLAAQETPPASSPPTASFQWFPADPYTGEPISLVSTSTDPASPITAFAWDLAGDGTFGTGGPSLSTSFATPGAHVVRLRVTSTDGLSSVTAETIDVTSPTAPLMQPFPVVRMAGSEYSFGVKVSLLTVQAPTGAKITVSCHGPGCPARTASVVATSKSSKSKAGLVTIVFGRFERSLHAGARLQIRISEPGVIGKYTSFVVRRDRLPSRVDTCLSPAGIQPIACPSS